MVGALKVALSDEEKKFAASKVCVTGATGYVASPIVQRLLAAGHTVHATCRNPTDESAVRYLKQLPFAADRLKLFKADLLVEGSFDAAMKGCSFVIHTASPYTFAPNKSRVREALLEPAVRGTENVLGSVERTETVRRVVFTSSIGAVCCDPDEKGRDHVYGVDDWNQTSNEAVVPYFYSKRLAEEKAWELCRKQTRWTLCAVLPCLVYGPPLSKRADNQSISMMKMLMTGLTWPLMPQLGMGVVDVRDVAAAHCRAMVKEDASGRYIVVNRSLYLPEVVDILRTKFPKAWLPRIKTPKWMLLIGGPVVGLQRDVINCMVNKLPLFDNSRAKNELGIQFLKLEETLEDMIRAMVDLGILRKHLIS